MTPAPPRHDAVPASSAAERQVASGSLSEKQSAEPGAVIDHRSTATIAARVRRLFPSGQFLRYLLVGGWNTIFGYGLYVLFVHLYSKLLPHRYLPLTVDLASLTSTPIGITNSFLSYKFFVFHTSGNYLKEWLRCFAVYGTGMIPNLIALPILTRVLQTVPVLHGVLAGYVAGAIMIGFTAIYSYFGHKKFSFRV